jgi:3-methyl-2-oxobutanoate hydroxymethyltransferase
MLSVAALQSMKRDRRKIVAAVVYDYQMAQIADRAGVDIVSAGDSVGVALWGHSNESELTIDQMMLVCKAVRRGVRRALVSCDVPLSALQQGTDEAVRAATRLVREGGADLVKVDVGACSIDAVRAIARENVSVWAQLSAVGDPDPPTVDRLVTEAQALEAAGAALLDFRHSGPVAGHAVVSAVRIPVIGGLGGGPWLDGRVRSVVAAIGYLASSVDDATDRYANVGATALTALSALCDDVRAARPLRGEAPASKS